MKTRQPYLCTSTLNSELKFCWTSQHRTWFWIWDHNQVPVDVMYDIIAPASRLAQQQANVFNRHWCRVPGLQHQLPVQQPCCIASYALKFTMDTNVLKYTRDTPLWESLYPHAGPVAPVGHKVQLKKSWGSAYHTRQSPASKISFDCEWFSRSLIFVGVGRQQHHTVLHTTRYHILYHIWYHIIWNTRPVPDSSFPYNKVGGIALYLGP